MVSLKLFWFQNGILGRKWVKMRFHNLMSVSDMRPSASFEKKPYFFFVASFTWNCCKMVVFFYLFLAQKWNWLWFHDFKWLKLWNRPHSVWKKMKLTAAAKPRAVSFIFFPDRMWRFHNFMPLEIHETISQFYFWCQKNDKRISTIFTTVFTWNLATIKKK